MADSILRRTRALNGGAPRNSAAYVLYWMQHAQRAVANPALERAAGWANECRLPLLVLFVIDPDYPDANARSYTFMLEGLRETMAAARDRGAHFALRVGRPPDVAVSLGRNAAVVVTDRGYLRHLREWRSLVAKECDCLVEEVEGEVVVPVEAASPRQETAARTIRPKLHKVVNQFLDLPAVVRLAVKADSLRSDEDETLDDIAAFVERLGCDGSVAPVGHSKGGTSEAQARLASFVAGDLDVYGDGRADIVDRHTSVLSPYLHFGQISPVEVWHAVIGAKTKDDSKAAYLEEMLVRRELAVNFVHYNRDYDSLDSVPAWAQATLQDHAAGSRDPTFTAQELEAGKTDDPYWNAAMREMRKTGYLHNHLRMYWGKRIVAYMKDARTAYITTVALNNKYFLDGRDANSFTNVSWLYGLHDRGWPENPVFGKVRIMKPSGLKRKFDIDAYVRWANAL